MEKKTIEQEYLLSDDISSIVHNDLIASSDFLEAKENRGLFT